MSFKIQQSLALINLEVPHLTRSKEDKQDCEEAGFEASGCLMDPLRLI